MSTGHCDGCMQTMQKESYNCPCPSGAISFQSSCTANGQPCYCALTPQWDKKSKDDAEKRKNDQQKENEDVSKTRTVSSRIICLGSYPIICALVLERLSAFSSCISLQIANADCFQRLKRLIEVPGKCKTGMGIAQVTNCICPYNGKDRIDYNCPKEAKDGAECKCKIDPQSKGP